MSEQKAPERIFISKGKYVTGPKRYWRMAASILGPETEVCYLRSDIATAHKEEAERLRAGLEKYGHHYDTCKSRECWNGVFGACTCGLDEALAGKQKEGA